MPESISKRKDDENEVSTTTENVIQCLKYFKFIEFLNIRIRWLNNLTHFNCFH
jgi:hypothetical protein